MTFPKDFVWGTATSSYQIEGGGLKYGRGVSIWDTFSKTEGKVYEGHTGDVACDHIHLYAEDIQIMKDLGVDAYRFSIAWGRILPTGTGVINEQGLDFYSRLIDELLTADITPHITLYHWDLPQALQDRGGWENPDSIEWFANYTRIVSECYGDRVKNWITHNEPFVVSMLGNLMGIHAPGKKDPVAAYTVAHHVLISHGVAVPIIRENSTDAEVGITLDQSYSMPLTDSWEDRQAASRLANFHNDWFLEPVFKGTYPTEIVQLLEPQGIFKNIDLSDISKAQAPTDFLGINYYTRNVVSHDPDDKFLQLKHHHLEDVPRTDFDWEVYPDGLFHTLMYLHNAYYPAKIYITENGASYDDPEPSEGIVDDPKRKAYFESHIDAVERACENGASVAGYFAWSLLDNFEWAEGYKRRFGLVHVDFDTQVRTPKASALYYRDRIKAERAKSGL
ncbi:MAG: GH1 family beta-glucosidase [Phototrophicaceae bacterium]